MRIRIVDAFTDRPFAGNPAGVVLLDEAFPDPAWMGQVATEVNLAETAFAHPLSGDPEADWALRWFTPSVEVDLCGHATLATAHVLRSTGVAAGTVRFRTRSGVLTVFPTGGNTITMDFPAARITAVPAPAGLAEALGVALVSVHETGALGDILVLLDDEKAVRALAPDIVALGRLPYRGVIVTTRSAGPEDFVSRFFGPAVGVDEDPVTGSAHTALAPFWSARLNRPELTGFQASARGGVVGTAVHGDRVRLTGRAVTVIDGELLIG